MTSSSSNSNNTNKTLDPYHNRDDAIAWLRHKGIEITDLAPTYHGMAFKFPGPLTTSKEISIIEEVFGRITLIDFENRIVHVFTATDNVME